MSAVVAFKQETSAVKKGSGAVSVQPEPRGMRNPLIGLWNAEVLIGAPPAPPGNAPKAKNDNYINLIRITGALHLHRK